MQTQALRGTAIYCAPHPAQEPVIWEEEGAEQGVELFTASEKHMRLLRVQAGRSRSRQYPNQLFSLRVQPTSCIGRDAQPSLGFRNRFMHCIS